MHTDAQALRSLPLEAFDHPQPGDAWERSRGRMSIIDALLRELEA